MTSPETPPPEPTPPRGIFVTGDGSWKATLPTITVLGIFMGALVGILVYFDNRFTVGIDRVEMRIGQVEQRLTVQITEVKTDLTNRIDQVETGLNTRIDRVEKRLSDRIDRVEVGLGVRIDEVKAELAASEARRAAVDAQLSADIERVAAGVTENRAAHRELAAFVRASWNREPPPATTEQDSAPAQ
ncbi:MAG: hypothetical protein OXG99_12095 [Alphaproteobacteria bacterium]|nr:hypothetical protein [Alphaproteobacteria bacterium]